MTSGPAWSDIGASSTGRMERPQEHADQRGGMESRAAAPFSCGNGIRPTQGVRRVSGSDKEATVLGEEDSGRAGQPRDSPGQTAPHQGPSPGSV